MTSGGRKVAGNTTSGGISGRKDCLGFAYLGEVAEEEGSAGTRGVTSRVPGGPTGGR